LARQVEVRADLADDIDPEPLRAGCEATLVYSLRSVDRGGAAGEPVPERHRRLLAAAERYDVVDLEAGRDLVPEVLDRIPPERRRISWHGPAADLGALRSRFAAMAEHPARLYLLAPAASSVADGLAPLQLLADLRRNDVTAFATGSAGTWSRLLAPRLGARIVFGRLRDPGPDGPMTVARLVADFGLPVMSGLRDLYGIVGASVGASLAPRIYNKGFRALGLPALCVPFTESSFDHFWEELVQVGLPGLGIAPRGLTVVTPHKESALAAATLATPGARKAGAANSLVRAGHAWQAATTTRLLAPLEAAGIDPAGRRAAIVGCGGAGRSVAAELLRAGARVTLVNRGAERGVYASELLGLPWVPLPSFAPEEHDLIVQATTVADDPPFEVARARPGTTLVDLVYRDPGTTPLVTQARERGLLALDGRSVLAEETSRQFELMTGQPMPPDAVEIAAAGPR
jgi:3-dehydroquinate dehydratase / shikimate dehydrogenase